MQNIPIVPRSQPTHHGPGDSPFLVEVDQDTFALCYPCDRVTWGNRYALADGQIVHAEADRYNPGTGWQDMPSDILVIGWVVSVHQRENDGFTSEAARILRPSYAEQGGSV